MRRRPIDCARLFLLLAVLLFGTRHSALAISVDFDVQPRAIRVGEVAICSFTVHGADNPAAPALPPIPGFQISMAGTERSFSFSTGAGKDSAVTFRYQLLPIQTGKFRIGPFVYEANGQKADLPAIDIEVLPPESQPQSEGSTPQQWSDLLFAALSTTRTNVYNQEVFDIDLAIYSRGLNFGRDIALMNMPASGLSLQPFQEHAATREVVNNQIYDVRRFRCKAQALTAGEFKLEPTLRIAMRVQRQPQRRSDPFGMFDEMFGGVQTQPVDVTPGPLTIRVLPLPAENQPPGFGGAVGRFIFDAQVKPTDVSAGDPITLTLQVAGEGNIENVTPPAIAAGNGFKVYEPKLVAKDGSRKMFEQVLIPRSADVKLLPALTFSFFDPLKASYETVTRGPFPLTVHASSNAALRLVKAPSDQPDARTVLLGTDIVYLKPAPTRWHRAGERAWYVRRGFLALQAIPPIAVLSLFFAVRRRAELERDVAKARRQRAPKSARAAIAKAEAALEHGDRKAFFEALWEALASYFGNRLNLPPGNVSAEIVVSALQKAGMTSQSSQELQSLFSECDQARFSVMGNQMSLLTPDEKPRLAELLNRLGLVLKSCERIRL